MMNSRIHARNMTRAGTNVLTRPDSETAGAVVLEPTFWSLLGFVLGACEYCQYVCKLVMACGVYLSFGNRKDIESLHCERTGTPQR